MRGEEEKMEMSQTTAFDLDQRWISEHYAELAGQYAEEWVAVQGQRVIAHHPDLTQLLSQAPDLEHTCIEFIKRQTPRIEENLTPGADAPSSR